MTRRRPRRQQSMDLERPFRGESGLQEPAERPLRGRRSRRTSLTVADDHGQANRMHRQHWQPLHPRHLQQLRTEVRYDLVVALSHLTSVEFDRYEISFVCISVSSIARKVME